MVGNIYITGAIGDEYDIEGNLIEKGVNLIDVIAQVKRQPQAESFRLYINSPGGDVQTGFDIYDYLKSLKKPVHSIGLGMVASIATVVFLAGDQREIRKGEFMVHLPGGGVFGSSDQIDDYNNMMKSTEKKIVKFYQDTAGLSEAEILPLMRNETWLTAEEAFKLGITNVKPEVIKPVAFFNTNPKNQKMDKKEKEGFLADIKNQIKEALAFLKPTNKIVFDAEQNEVDFYELGENDPVTVGAKANISGTPAEGEVLMTDGNTYVFAGGELTEIKEVEEFDEDMEQMKAENEALKAKVEELEATNQKVVDTNAVLEASNKKLLGVVGTVRKLEAKLKFDEPKPKPGKQDPAEKGRFAKAKAKLKEN